MKQRMISMVLAASLCISGCISNVTVLHVDAAKEQEIEASNFDALKVLYNGKVDKYEKLRKNKHHEERTLKQSVEMYKGEKEARRKKVKNHTNSSEMNTLNWGGEMVHVDTEEMSNENIPEQKVKVAIIDSGINYSDDIDVAERKNFIPDDSGDEEGMSLLYEDISGHGTNIAGVIAAKDNDLGITGINSNVELYSARVLDANMQAPISRVIEAIDWAIEKDVDIINLSFTTKTNSAELLAAIQRAYDADILLVAAAGNSEEGSDGVMYPAAYAEVIAIGSIDTNGEVSSFSPEGQQVELVAPGELITSTDVFDTVSTHSGTSYAAPYVTGIASKLWEKDKECSRDFIRAVLDISANLYGNEKDYGYGLVDYAYAEKVYEALKPMMGDEQQFNEILEYAVNICGITNPSTVPVMDKTEDMVEGAWSQDNHQLALSNITLTSDRGRRLLLAGCIISDNDDYAKLYSMKKHPYFHGYYRYIGDEKRGYTNYIAGSLYLTKVAEAMMQGKLSSFYTSDPLVDIDGHQLSRFINNTYINGEDQITWADVEYYIEVKVGVDFTPNNKTQRALVVYGMALHSMMDIFAHSAMTGPGGTVIIHEQGADDTTEIPMRYEMAKKICRKALGQICGLHDGQSTRAYSTYGHCNIHIFDFLIEKKYYTYFRLVDIKKYALEVCNANSTVFPSSENTYIVDYGKMDGLRVPGLYQAQ